MKFQRTQPRPAAGDRFGRLVVVVPASDAPGGNARVLCACDCGQHKIVRISHLRAGAVSSCGCFQQESRSRSTPVHSHCTKGERSQTYESWTAMKDRCGRPEHPAYPEYGGRGIRVCYRWARFENFLADMGERPPSKTLDRCDTNGNYEPGNCRWATRKVQARNRRNNHLLTLNGVTLCISAWAERQGLLKSTIRERLRRNWSIEKALTTGVSQ